MPNEAQVSEPGFFKAVASKKRFISAGMAIGLGLIAISTYKMELFGWILSEHARDIVATALEHIGMGFIVAAIAVVFYEWSAHFKEFLQLSTQLTELKGAIGEKALGDALKTYIRTGDAVNDGKIIAAVTDIVSGLKRLQDEGDWTQMGFQRFVVTMIENVSANTNRFVELSTRLRKDSGNTNTYGVVVHNPAELVDTILAEQLRGLPAAGRYSVVTNVHDWWEGSFPNVLEQSRAAFDRGVDVRRILVLAKVGANAYSGERSEIERILNTHSAGELNTYSAGDYRVRVFDDEARKELKRIKMKHADAADEIFLHHFAIMDNRQSDHCLRIEASEPGLSEFRLGGMARGARLMECFDLVWANLPDLDRAKAKQILERWPD